MVGLVVREDNMKEILTDKERYEIINGWLTYGPTSYYNLVRQTELFIIEKYEGDKKSPWYSKLLDMFNQKKV